MVAIGDDEALTEPLDVLFGSIWDTGRIADPIIIRTLRAFAQGAHEAMNADQRD